ncbi:hypothetical protein Barb6_00049 [Bacteroidales bacterium Barb6]|nr:hypothetical protein Barb6_00049 [Bacteroidales bacterium Barb6]
MPYSARVINTGARFTAAGAKGANTLALNFHLWYSIILNFSGSSLLMAA